MPSVPPITSTTTATPFGSTAIAPPTQTLGQQDFLKLLVTQMTSQDPMNPMKDTEFVAQMATFSSLQNSVSMESDMASMQASGLLGRTVTLNVPDGTQPTGVVSGVQWVSGTPQIVVNGQNYTLSQLSSITP